MELKQVECEYGISLGSVKPSRAPGGTVLCDAISGEPAVVIRPVLTNFGNDERNVVRERPVAPFSHVVDNGLPHFGQCQVYGIEDDLRKTFDAEHYLVGVKDLDQSVRIEH